MDSRRSLTRNVRKPRSVVFQGRSQGGSQGESFIKRSQGRNRGGSVETSQGRNTEDEGEEGEDENPVDSTATADSSGGDAPRATSTPATGASPRSKSLKRPDIIRIGTPGTATQGAPSTVSTMQFDLPADPPSFGEGHPIIPDDPIIPDTPDPRDTVSPIPLLDQLISRKVDHPLPQGLPLEIRVDTSQGPQFPMPSLPIETSDVIEQVSRQLPPPPPPAVPPLPIPVGSPRAERAPGPRPTTVSSRATGRRSFEEM